VTGFEPLGRWLIIAGLALALTGVLFVLGPRIPLVGRLPGDIRIEQNGVVIFLPIGTMILISIVLTILLNLFSRR
jgi:hypothetical protein